MKFLWKESRTEPDCMRLHTDCRELHSLDLPSLYAINGVKCVNNWTSDPYAINIYKGGIFEWDHLKPKIESVLSEYPKVEVPTKSRWRFW